LKAIVFTEDEFTDFWKRLFLCEHECMNIHLLPIIASRNGPAYHSGEKRFTNFNYIKSSSCDAIAISWLRK
jgi:hypothetical protein